MSKIDDRSQMLLGEEKLKAIQDKEVIVFGLGGVGGTAFMALVRSGIKKIHAVDCDDVDESNLNRQILFTKNDIGKDKALVAKEVAFSIREDVEVISESYRVDETSIREKDYSDVDFIIDAIDDIKGKMAIIEFALERNIPFAISLGMGNRIDPTKIKMTTLDKTEGDPLAKILRHDLRAKGIDLKKIPCVISTEEPLVKGKTPSSMMMVPSSAGLALAILFIQFCNLG